MPLFTNQNCFPVNGRTVLITGGSQGMGRSVARMLAQRGADVVIVARDAVKLKEAMTYISSGAADKQRQRFHYISADLTQAAICTAVMAETTAWNDGSPPDVVWCCAGTAHPTLFIDTAVDKLADQMAANYFSAAYTAHATLRAWLSPPAPMPSVPGKAAHHDDVARDQRGFHLIFTSSVLGLFPTAGYAPYSPCKSALRTLADSLSMETRLYEGARRSAPVSLHTVFPATIRTPGLEAENAMKSDLAKKLEEDDAGQSADEVAAAAIAGLERGEELVATTWFVRLILRSVLGGSRRRRKNVEGSGVGLSGVSDALLGAVGALVMAFMRAGLERKTRRWGQMYGSSGMMTRAPAAAEKGA